MKKLMNNKKIGSDFEEDFCKYLSRKGYWVHFLSPAKNGSQPFDIIAVKGSLCNIDIAFFDCKTLSKGRSFPLERIEDNQELSFDFLFSCLNEGLRIEEINNRNKSALFFFAIKAKDGVYLIDAIDAIRKKRAGQKSIKLKEENRISEVYSE